MQSLLEAVKTYPAFIFDMDGTLLNSEVWHREAWNHMLEEHGAQPLSTQLLIDLAGLPTRVLAQKLVDEYNVKGDPHDMTVLKTRLYLDEYMSKVGTFPLICDLLKEVKAMGRAVAIATSSHQEEAVYQLERNGLLEHIDALITGEMVKNGKPAPDIYLMAARKIGATPAQCLVFEDTITGMKGCKNAGMAAVKVFDGNFDCDHIIQPDEPWAGRD